MALQPARVCLNAASGAVSTMTKCTPRACCPSCRFWFRELARAQHKHTLRRSAPRTSDSD
eukprot:360538-Chlamydomonas_euryale.AAC.3